jgi:hypothetical protein
MSSSPYLSPHPDYDPAYAHNTSYQQSLSQQRITQQRRLSAQSDHGTRDAQYARAVPQTEAEAEIEILRRRIEQLQRPQAPPQHSQQLPLQPQMLNITDQKSRSQHEPNIDNWNALAPQGPPPYTRSGASSISSMNDLSSLPSVPRAPTLNSYMRSSQLTKPVAIPATNARLGSPFLRSYPPSLANYALPPEVFLRFLDNLNRVAVASPPLQVLGLAGTITSFVPLATAQIVGNAVSFAAQAGTVAVSKGRTELYLREANKDIFGPRGLKAEIAKIDAVAKIAGIPILDAAGKIDKKSRLLDDIDVQTVRTVSGQERRLMALSQWIAPLEVTPLPEIEQQKNPLSRLNQAASERQRRKGEEKLIEDREKAHKKMSEDGSKAEREYQKEMRKLDKEEEKVRRKEDGHKLEKELEKIEKERRKAEREYEKESDKLMKEDKEEKALRKILWLVIRNLEDDSGAGPDPYAYQEV